jgi:hypothetical protein
MMQYVFEVPPAAAERVRAAREAGRLRVCGYQHGIRVFDLVGEDLKAAGESALMFRQHARFGLIDVEVLDVAGAAADVVCSQSVRGTWC